MKTRTSSLVPRRARPAGAWLHAGFLLVGVAIFGRLLAADFSLESLGFTTITQSSAAGDLTVEGALGGIRAQESTGADFSLRGSLRTIRPAAPSSWLGTNLLPFGDAEGIEASETPLGGLPGWGITGALLVTRWGTPGGWPLETDSAQPDRGLNFFAGGPDTGPDSGLTTATYGTLLPLSAAAIDSGQLAVELSGWFGGFQGQADTAFLSASILDGTGKTLATLQIGGVTPEMRTNRTGLIRDRAVRPLPVGARRVEVMLSIQRSAPLGWNDGYADNLRLAIIDRPPSSVELTARLTAGGQLELTARSEPGRTYTLEWRDVLGPSNWSVLAGSERTGTGSELRYALPVEGPVTGRFYRLRIEP